VATLSNFELYRESYTDDEPVPLVGLGWSEHSFVGNGLASVEQMLRVRLPDASRSACLHSFSGIRLGRFISFTFPIMRCSGRSRRLGNYYNASLWQASSRCLVAESSRTLWFMVKLNPLPAANDRSPKGVLKDLPDEFRGAVY
jgi:hypothetical protein